ncbi:MAG TPA: stage III sporulation protein AA [Bacilli bacterium]
MPASIFEILPLSLGRILQRLPTELLGRLEEIRVRESKPLEIIYQGKYSFVSAQGKLLEHPQDAYAPNHEDCIKLLDLLTNHSMYTLDEELKRGYITVQGGHRVGLAGRTVLDQGCIKQIKDISSFNIRIAREIQGAGLPLLPYLMDMGSKSVHHTLIISPPQQGKTTLIRDLARLISYGWWPDAQAKWKGLKVGMVDERSELAACFRGVPGFDVGPRTDVLDSCPKAEGMMMMIRSMSPDVLVVDEIGRREDVLSIHEALHAGIRVIATAHGGNLQDVMSRPILSELIAARVFSRYVILGNSRGAGTIDSIYNESKSRLMTSALTGKAGG